MPPTSTPSPRFLTDPDTAARLRRAGFPPHYRYDAVLRVFMANSERALSVTEVYSELLKTDVKANFVGVYRIVHRLRAAGLLDCTEALAPSGRVRSVYLMTLPGAADEAANTAVHGALASGPTR